MPLIFLDESGDMGFDFSKSKTSKYFVITCLAVTSKRPIEKIIRNIMKNFTAAERKRHCGTLHAYQETDRTRRKLLNDLASKDVSVLSIYLNKGKVYAHLKAQKHVLYNYVTNILLDRIYNKALFPNEGDVTIVAARRETNKLLNENFKNYLQRKVSSEHIQVEIKTGTEEKCLQAVDFVCWAIFRNREHGDDTYRNIIKRIIIEESPLYP